MSSPRLAEQIAHLALNTFDSLPQKCKPRISPNGCREWTPMSAIVLSRANELRPAISDSTQSQITSSRLKIVSLATGTKSLPASALPKCNGLVLHDCHAEILALRGLNYWFLSEIERMLLSNITFKSEWLDDASTTMIHDPSSTKWHDQRLSPFTLKPGIEISLFSTTAPCGDASMELLMAAAHAAGRDISPWTGCTGKQHPQRQQRIPSDTEAKSRTEAQAPSPPLGRGYFSRLGALRRKPARADAEISLSKSCSDKLMLKQVTGLLRFPADLLIEGDQEETFLKRLVVYPDQYDRLGYERAFALDGRLRHVMQAGELGKTRCKFFDVEVLPEQFRRFDFDRMTHVDQPEGGSGKRATSNVSALWIADGDKEKDLVEVLVNGVKQGYRQFDHRNGKGSAVCRRKMLEKAVNIAKLLHGRDAIQSPWQEGLLVSGTEYSVLKSLLARRKSRELKEIVLDSLGGWLKGSAEDDFQLMSSSFANAQKSLESV